MLQELCLWICHHVLAKIQGTIIATFFKEYRNLLFIVDFYSLLQSNGLRILEELLCSRGSLIEDRIEAAGVLAQITSPWISDNHKINQLDNYVYNMVNALTGKSFDIAFRKGLKRRLGKELEHHQKSLNDKKNR